MAREARRVDGGWTDFVPDVADNREDPEPFMLKVRPATAKEFSKELNAHLNMTGRETETQRKKKLEYAMREMFRVRVADPIRYSIPNKDTGEMIIPKTSVELFDAITEHGDTEEQSALTSTFEAIGDQSKLRAGLWEILRSRSAPTS